MNHKIAILAPKHFCDHIQFMLQFYHLDFSKKCELYFYEYHHQDELAPLYDSLYEEMDGFCVTGEFSVQLLKALAHKPKKPVQSISAKSTEFFKEFFRLLNENRSLDLSRIVIDAFLWGGDSAPKTIDEFIITDRRLVDIRKDMKNHMTTEQILNSENLVLENAKKLWESGAIDHVVCRLASAYPLLCEAGIPCSFVYPASDTIVDAIEILTNRISLKQIEKGLPAVIYITSEELQKDILSGLNTNDFNLQKAILEFDREYMTGFVLKQSINGYEIYTTKQVVQNITDHFTNCSLSNYILSHFNMQTQIGYGIGQDVMRARYHALEACSIAKNQKESYLIMADGSLIGPLNAKNVLNVSNSASSSVIDAAEKSGLAISTIQRILSVEELMGTNELTTQDLASSLQVTVANANRFMNAMVAGGCAEIISKKKSHSKGRPSRVYRILIQK